MKTLATLAIVFIPLLTTPVKAISCNGVNFLDTHERYLSYPHRIIESISSTMGIVPVGENEISVGKLSYPGNEGICISSLPHIRMQ